MYRVALNVAISSLRGDVRRRRHTVPAEEEHLGVPAPEPDPAEGRRALLREAMERVDPFDRALLVLHLDLAQDAVALAAFGWFAVVHLAEPRFLLLALFLLAPLAFVPLLVVAAKGLLGVDLWSSPAARAWLVANLVFGGAFLASGLLLTRMLASRPWASRLGRLLAGQTLADAERELAAASRLAAGGDAG